jgi:hypothetical protein
MEFSATILEMGVNNGKGKIIEPGSSSVDPLACTVGCGATGMASLYTKKKM